MSVGQRFGWVKRPVQNIANRHLRSQKLVNGNDIMNSFNLSFPLASFINCMQHKGDKGHKRNLVDIIHIIDDSQKKKDL